MSAGSPFVQVLRQAADENERLKTERQHMADTLEALHTENKRLRAERALLRIQLQRRTDDITTAEAEIARLRSGGAYQAGYNDGRSDSTTDDHWKEAAKRRSTRVLQLRDIIIRANLALASGDLLAARDILDETHQ